MKEFFLSFNYGGIEKRLGHCLQRKARWKVSCRHFSHFLQFVIAMNLEEANPFPTAKSEETKCVLHAATATIFG